MEVKELIRAAVEARKKSYAPYSGYKVGAAVLSDDGSIIKGCNVENASYPAGICAERNAIFSAVAMGYKGFKAIAVVGGRESEEDTFSDYACPCGICRQVMREFTEPSDLSVYIARSEDDYMEYTLEDLLPESFGPGKLKDPRFT